VFLCLGVLVFGVFLCLGCFCVWVFWCLGVFAGVVKIRGQRKPAVGWLPCSLDWMAAGVEPAVCFFERTGIARPLLLLSQRAGALPADQKSY
jgi:hypothetical protein